MKIRSFKKALSIFTAAAMSVTMLTRVPLNNTAYAQSLPESYAPSTLLGIENQGNTNLCWAFRA